MYKRQRYNIPIIITENGLGAYDKLEEDETVHDDYRIDSVSYTHLDVYKRQKPGIYKGKIKVTADELDKAYEFDYQFEVLDLVQPETSETDTQIQIWQHPFAVANYYGVEEEEYFTEEHFKYMRSSMKEYKDLGGKDVVANIVEEAWGCLLYTS